MRLPDEVVFLANAGIEREVRKSEEHATDDPHEESTEANGRIGKGSPAQCPNMHQVSMGLVPNSKSTIGWQITSLPVSSHPVITVSRL